MNVEDICLRMSIWLNKLLKKGDWATAQTIIKYSFRLA